MITSRPSSTPVDQLRALLDHTATVFTAHGQFTGRVLSCTRLSVWLICGDDDVVLACEEIVAVSEAPVPLRR